MVVARRQLRLLEAWAEIHRLAHTLVWPNGADFDPTTLHDWPDLADELREAALRWRDGEQAH